MRTDTTVDIYIYILVLTVERRAPSVFSCLPLSQSTTSCFSLTLTFDPSPLPSTMPASLETAPNTSPNPAYTILPYINIQKDYVQVISDVSQSIVKREDIWISAYLEGHDSIHAKVRVFKMNPTQDMTHRKGTSIYALGQRFI